MAGKKRAKKVATKVKKNARKAGRPAGAKNKVKEAPQVSAPWALYRKTAFGLYDAILVSTHATHADAKRALAANVDLRAGHQYFIEFTGTVTPEMDAYTDA